MIFQGKGENWTVPQMILDLKWSRYCTEPTTNLDRFVTKNCKHLVYDIGKLKVSVKENEVPTEKNSSRASIFATKASKRPKKGCEEICICLVLADIVHFKLKSRISSAIYAKKCELQREIGKCLLVHHAFLFVHFFAVSARLRRASA